MPHYIVYKPADRPECEALVDGRWVPAEIRCAISSWAFALLFCVRKGMVPCSGSGQFMFTNTRGAP